MKRNWQIIQSGPLDPFQNMDIDAAILSDYLKDRVPTFRTYSWNIPSLTFGVSQKPGEVLDLERCLRENVPVVKRMTGGGIILHDDEITYSLACSAEDIGSGGTIAGSFKAVCSFLIEFYKRLGLDARFAVDCRDAESGKLGGFSDFCFAAKEKYDIVIGGKKIGGNAQKRTRGAIFQHGSIPITFDRRRAASFLKDRHAAEGADATSLEELLGRRPDSGKLISILKESFEKTIVAQ